MESEVRAIPMAWYPSAPVPPSEAKDGEAYKLRFLGIEEPDRPAQKGYGNLYVLGILACIAVVLIVSSMYLGYSAQADVHVTVSNVAAQVGPCRTYPSVGNGFQTVDYSFLLTNSGGHDAVAILDLYANGENVARTGAFTVPAGKSVPGTASVEMYECGPVTPWVALYSVSAVG